MPERTAPAGYRPLMDPELQSLSYRVRFRPALLRPAALAMRLMDLRWRPPAGVARRRLVARGLDGNAVPLDLYEPADASGEAMPALLYAHGGGFGFRAAPYQRDLACSYALGARCLVLFPDYRLLPAHPYPAAVRDVLGCYAFALSHTRELGIDAGRVGVGGDSAGGALAACCANEAERHGLPAPRAQLLCYPVCDARCDTASMRRFVDTPLWDAANNRRMWELYLRGVPAARRPQASPALMALPASPPPTRVETAELDCLHDEGAAYAERLRAAGADVELVETRGTVHGFDAVAAASVTRTCVAGRVAFLRRTLGVGA